MILGYTENANITSANGLFSSVNDPYSTSQPNNGAQNTPGICAAKQDSTGRFLYHRYVRLNPGTPPSSYIVGPVYWQDNTFTVVTTTMSNGVTAGPNSIAGILLNAQATASVLTGNWVWIFTGGYLPAVVVAASTAKDDILIGTTGDQTFARVAAGTAPTYKPAAIALTNVASTLSDIFVQLDGYCF